MTLRNGQRLVGGLVAAFAILAVIAFATQQHAQSPNVKGRNPLPEQALGQTTWIEEFDVSPDGETLVFKSARGGNYNLWLVDVGGGEPRQLTSHPVPFRAKNPRWSPDGRWIAYQVDQHLTRQSQVDDVYVVPASGGAPRNLTDTSWSSESNIVWSPDSRHIAFTSSHPAWLNETLPLLGGGILRAEVATGKLERLSERGGSDLQWSPDGRYIAYTANRVRDEKTFISNGDVYMLTVATGEERLLTDNTLGFRERDPHWSPDSRRLVLTSDRNGYDNVAVLDIESGQTTMLTDLPLDHANPTWSPDGRSIAYVVNHDYNYYIETVDPRGGDPVRVTDRAGVNGGMERIQLRGTFRWLPDSGRIAYTYMSPATTSDLWVVDLRDRAASRITDSRHASLTDEDRFVWPELFKYTSFDGLEVQGFVYKPKDVEDGDRAPFMMFYRANSSGQHPVGWQPYVQYYVSKGYVVFAPNFRGSTGQGKEYFEIIHTWGGDHDIKDAIIGMELLAERELIDRNRLGMVGGSTGGYFVLATLIHHPKMFKAAVSWYTGTADLAAIVDQMGPNNEFGWLGTMIGGTPLTNPKNYYDRSLVHFVEPVESPLLLIFAEGDLYFGAVRQLVPVLDHYGKEYDYKLYEQEPHGWYHWRPENVEDSLRLVGEFIDSNILGIDSSN